MTPYAFHPEVEADLAEAYLLFEARVDGLGKSFVDAVGLTISLVRQYAEIGTPVDQSRRRVLVRGFPYAVVYEIHPDLILILALAHVRRGARILARARVAYRLGATLRSLMMSAKPRC